MMPQAHRKMIQKSLLMLKNFALYFQHVQSIFFFFEIKLDYSKPTYLV